MTYLELVIDFRQKYPWNDIAVTLFAELNFDGFDLSNNVFKAYIDQDKIDKNQVERVLDDLLKQTRFDYKVNRIEQKNWNEVWESSFSPVSIENKLHILAPFHNHENLEGIKIFIEPKMSFGTGHHPTTYLMCKRILKIDLNSKTLLDMGSGTGILSILAEYYNAKEIVSVEIDPGAFENLKENISKNRSKRITCLNGSFEIVQKQKFDVILANINKNVLLENFSNFDLNSNVGTELVLSGFLLSDKNQLIAMAEQYKFSKTYEDSMDEWLLLSFQKN